MNNFEQFSEKWNELYTRMQPGLAKTGTVCQKTGDIVSLIGMWIWRLRKIVMAVPVVWLAIYLARLNGNMLPELVGIGLQNSGEYVKFVTREAAVRGPLAVTAGCLLLMMLSRKTLYPWLVSLFSLALPLVLLLTNIFPA